MKSLLRFALPQLVLVSLSLAQPRDPVVLLFAGDLTLDRHIEQVAGEDPESLFHEWNAGPSDLFMVNLEHPITTSDFKVPKEFNFKMHPKYLRALQRAGITVVNAANNHIADFGLAGLEDTMRFLDSVGIRYVGIGRNLQEARRGVIVHLKGWRVGLLGYHGYGRFSATAMRAGIAPRVEQYIVEDVRRLRPHVDYLVVNFHWGKELALHPDHEQIQLAHRVVDAGADLIVGHHPHVLQGMESYRGATIAYSLGNFVFGGNARHTYETAVLKVVLSTAPPKISLVPVVVNKWRPHVAEETTALRVKSLVQERSVSFRRPFQALMQSSE
jgi:poly-gamma-glutamate synthesis protein (capsule biosynthesis protein)